jgi:hypothetical protein
VNERGASLTFNTVKFTKGTIMREAIGQNRVVWCVLGLAAGLAVAYLWPHEPVYATTADRDAQFAMLTVPVGTSAAGINDPMDGVFVLDFLTGQLRGATINRQIGKFTNFYTANLARDFNVDPKAQPHYALVSGYSQLASQRGLTFASGMIYAGELSSGKIIAYAFPWKEAPRPAPQVIPLIAVDNFQWREPAQKDQ